MAIAVEPKLARLSVDIGSPVARIVLCHAPLNVIDIAMMEELAYALKEMEARSEISVIVLSGAGKAFSAGVDVAAHTPVKVEEMLLKFHAPVACTALAALVGQKRAAELILTGRTISGVEAAAIGLANRSVTDKELAEVVDHTVQELLTLSPAALGVTKKAVYGWDSMHFDKGLARAEKIYLEELMKTADAREGISAFLEKRKPNWTGK